MFRVGLLTIVGCLILACNSHSNFQKQKFTDLKLKSRFEKLNDKTELESISEQHTSRKSIQEKAAGSFVLQNASTTTEKHLSEKAIAKRPDVKKPVFGQAKAVDSQLLKQELAIMPYDTIITIQHDTIICRISSTHVNGLAYRLPSDLYWHRRSIAKDSVLKYANGDHAYAKGDADDVWLVDNKNADKLFKAVKISMWSTIGIGLAALVLFLLALDFAAILGVALIVLGLVTITLFFLGRIARKAEKLKTESPLDSSLKLVWMKVKGFFILAGMLSLVGIIFWLASFVL